MYIVISKVEINYIKNHGIYEYMKLIAFFALNKYHELRKSILYY